MRSLARIAGRGRGRDQRGNGVIEAAFVMPLFLLLLFGVIEGGSALEERLSVANMALVGARSASGNGADLLSDFVALSAIKAGAGGVSASQVDTIVVYKTAGPGTTVPVACKTASVAGVCNHYTGADLAKASSEFGCVGPPAPMVRLDNAWCPTTRKIALSGVNGPPDYVGVYVHAAHRKLTGVLGANLAFHADTIMRLEPRTLI